MRASMLGAGGAVVALLMVAAPGGSQGPRGPAFPGSVLGRDRTEPLPADLNQSRPRVYLGRGGRVYQLWTDEWAGLGRHVRLQRSGDGGRSWLSEPLLVDHDKPEGARSTTPSFALDGTGRLYVAWQSKLASGRKHVRFTSSPDDGVSWSSPSVLVNTLEAGLAPVLAAPGGGDVYIAWYDERHGRLPEAGGVAGARNLTIYFNRSTDFGRTWQADDLRLSGEVRVRERVPQGYVGQPREVSVPFIAARPVIRADAQGRVFLAWMDNREGRMEIYFRASVDRGRSWGPEINVSRGGSSAKEHELVTDGQGRVFLVWTDNRDGPPTVVFARSEDAGRTWEVPQRLSRGAGTTSSLAPSMALGPDGRLYVAWQDLRYGREDVFVNVSADGGKTWLVRDVRLDRDDAGTAISRNVHVVAGGPGEVAVLWEDDRAGLEQVLLTYSTDGGRTWLPREIRVDEGTGARERARNPHAAWAPDGVLHVVWERWGSLSRDAEKRVAYRRLSLHP